MLSALYKWGGRGANLDGLAQAERLLKTMGPDSPCVVTPLYTALVCVTERG